MTFLPAVLPRRGRLAWWSPDGGAPPRDTGATTTLTVARARGTTVRRVPVEAAVLGVEEGLAALLADPAPGASAACWQAAARLALDLVARGRLLPGLTEADEDAWRAGPLDATDLLRLRDLAAALPPEGHPVALEGRSPLLVPAPEALLRAFLDAVADTLPRTPAAADALGAPFAATAPQRLPGARGWAALAAAGQDAGVSLSLRLDLSAYGLFDPEGEEGRRGAGAAVLQVHSLADPTRIADAAALWSGERLPGFGPRARIDAALALRRAARVWAPLERLADQPVPDVLSLDDAELSDLLGVAAERLRAAGVPVHWPRELARELTAEAEVRGAPGSATDGTPFFDADRLLEFRWQVALGGERLSEAEMDELAEAHRPVVRLRDQWVVVDPEVVRRARKRDLGLLDPVDALGVA
ncbi:SNF2 helicase-associated domain-containing protein, partial [Streptomyces albidoflavus]